ncbi:MAG: TULIP family P47-like protein [Anaerolineaceae bacterium]|nr:TULIP family P47-like protein [Anaerolineaceae bacterium]
MDAKTDNTTLPLPKVVKELPVNKNADTNDWDTVFAIHFIDANTAIVNNWPHVNEKAKKVSQTASDTPEYNINGTLGPWQLTIGGDGKNIRMVCPFKDGLYKAGSENYDVTGYGVVIEVGMEWVPNPDQFAFTISGNVEVDAIKTDLDKSSIDDQLKSEFKKKGVTLSASAKVTLVKAGAEWMITDGKINYYIFHNEDKYKDEFLQIYQFQDTWKNNLKILAADASKESPAVIIITIENNKTTGIAAAVLPELLSQWFNSNIGDFNYVFSALNLSPNLSTSAKYAWIKPTGTSYAVTDNGSLENSVFGVLTMTQHHTSPTSHEVSPNAIPEGTGANAGFLISGTEFMKNMMLTGARTIFDNAPASSFDITNDGLTVTNNADMTWGRFKKEDSATATIGSSYAADLDKGVLSKALVQALEEKYIYVDGYSAHVTTKGLSWYLISSNSKTTYLLELTKDGKNIDVFNSIVFQIKKQQFKMSLDNSYMEIQFIDLVYPENWEYDVHVNYTEQVALGLATVGGKKIFWFDQVTKDMTVNVTKTKTAVTVAIVEDVTFAVIGLVAVALPLLDGIRAAVAIGEVTEGAGSAAVGVEGFVEATESTSEVDLVSNETDGLINGAKQVRGGWTGFKNAFTATRWKVLGGIAGLIGAGVATQAAIEEIMQAIAKGDWEKVPAFDEFANDVIVPYTWPGVTGYDLKSTQLAASLQIGLETQHSDDDA